VALTDVQADCGPMVFVRGSHQWGYVPDLSDFFGKEDQAALRNHIQRLGHPDWEERAAILPPGGVSFHHNLTYHGSGPNLSGQPRRSFAIHLRTEKSRPRDNARQGLTQFLDNLEYNPVIYGKRSDFLE
jgi:ectoine hydroxylase-related dioxygenase (phytanoyl-CoA dioxygenase family)